MRVEEVRVCIARVGGTNCDLETRLAFEDLGARVDVVHMSRLVRRGFSDYHILVFPGGFSYGDHIRAGAVWAKELLAKVMGELRGFLEEGKPILGVCNGFQVLVEAGLLPGFEGISPYPEAALATNNSNVYECRWVYLKHENRGNCVFTRKLDHGALVRMPVAHAEGKLVFPSGKAEKVLERLYENDQLVFRYAKPDGAYAEGEYPYNPNGSFHDIAGICNPWGNVFGLMPHPERAYYGWQLPDWTRLREPPEYGDGRLIFESAVEYVARKF